MSTVRPRPEVRETVEAAPWELGPPPAGQPTGRAGTPASPPFARGAPPRSRRTAYRIRVLRRLLAAVLVGVAVWSAVRALALPAAAGRVDAVVAARDLAAGAVLHSDDLAVASRVPSELPREAPRDPSPLVGQTLAGPVTEGEVLTAARLTGPGLLAGQPPGVVAVGVPLADATLVPSLRAGDSVTVHGAGAAQEVARGTVLVVQPANPSALTGQAAGASVVLAATAGGAASLAAATAGPSPGFFLALHRRLEGPSELRPTAPAPGS